MRRTNYLPEIGIAAMLAGILAASSGMGCSSSKSSPADRFALLFGGGPHSAPSPEFLRSPLSFEPNVGQSGPAYSVLAQSPEFFLFLSSDRAAIDLRSSQGASEQVFEMRLEGARQVRMTGGEPLVERRNYFLGSDPNGWITNVPTYRQIRFESVYPAVDLVYYGRQEALEYDFVVRPGGDPRQIRWDFGEAAVSRGTDGSLEVRAGGSMIRWKAPLVYQDTAGGRVIVKASYRLNEPGGASFDIDGYDRNLPLVIDPVLDLATFTGAGGNESTFSVQVDSQGNIYLMGTTTSAFYPTSPGAFQTPGGGASFGDVFLTKLNPGGDTVIFSTRLGSSDLEMGTAMAVDGGGNIYLTGTTRWEDFPVTTGVLQRTYAGRGQGDFAGGDCFLTKLNPAGSALVYSTYLGGSGGDSCFAVQVDSAGNAYLAGLTESRNFPATDTAPQRTFRGGNGQTNMNGNDGFIAKVNPSGAGLVYATFLGGTRDDAALSLAIDNAGAAYVSGFTRSIDFPVTAGAAQVQHGGEGGQDNVIWGDAFAAKLNPGGTAFEWATLLGGRADDIAWAIRADSAGNAFVAGGTLSSNFPVSSGALQTTFGGTGSGAPWLGGDAFLVKLNPTGTQRIYSTFLGGSQDDIAWGLALDSAGRPWVTGNTLSRNFPATQDAAQRQYGGEGSAVVRSGDAFIAQLNGDGNALIYATYYGGSADETGHSLFVDRAGTVYLGGNTSSPNFPLAGNGFQKAYGGGSGARYPFGDGFLLRLREGSNANAGAPTVAAVRHAGSYEGGSVSPGLIAVAFGERLGPAQLVAASAGPSGFPTELGGVQFLFDGVAAPMVYALNGQSSFIVPYSVAGKATTELVVVSGGQRSAPLRIPVTAALPGLFTANGSGKGQAAALNADNSFNSSAMPVNKGGVVVLFGTGEGQTSPAGVDGRLATQLFPKPNLPVQVIVGGRPVEPLYAGAAPGLVAGVIQINAPIPADTPSGDVPIVVRIGTSESAPGVTIAVR